MTQTPLMSPSLDWNEAALRIALAPLLPGIEVQVAASLGSTNSVLLDSLRAAEPADDAASLVQRRRSVESRAFHRRAPDRAPRLLVAEHQTAGRGRQGRAWHAAVGASLTFSLAVPIQRADLSGLSLAVGVALVEALDPVAPRPSGQAEARPASELVGLPGTFVPTGAGIEKGIRIGIKWPNDLWSIGIDGPANARKLGGILIETVSALGQRWAVIGVGLNVLAVDAPGATTGVASLSELDADARAPSVLARIALPLAEAIAAFERDGFAAFAARFSGRDLLRGLAVTTTSPDAPEGIARGVDAHGALLVNTPGGVFALHGGEVSVRPAAANTSPGPAC